MRRLVFILVLLSMATVFILKTFTDTLFLSVYGVELLPHFLATHAFVLIIATVTYSALLRHFKSIYLDLILITSLGSLVFASPMIVAWNENSVFVVVLLLSVLSTTVNLALWNTIAFVTSGRGTRYFLPRAGAAATLGAVIGSLASTLIVSLSAVETLTVISGMIVIIIAAVRILLGRGKQQINLQAKACNRKDSKLNDIRRLRNALIIATLFEALVVIIIDFGFKREVSSHFNKSEMAMFFSLFFGLANAGLLLVQWFGSTTLLATQPLRRTLASEPLVLIFTGVLWLLWPTLIFVTMGRFTEIILKFGIARPAQEIALSPMPPNQRQRWKILLRGSFSQGSSVLAGLILIVIAPLILHYTWFLPATLILSAALWWYAQRLVAAAYLDTLGLELGLYNLAPYCANAKLLFDRDGLHKLVTMVGDADSKTAHFARDILYAAEHQASDFAPHLADADMPARIVLYELIAERPGQVCPPELRESVLRESEQDEAALNAGLIALMRHHDRGAEAKAWSIVNHIAPDQAQGLAMTAWNYLANLGALDSCERLLDVHKSLLNTDGAQAAQLSRHIIDRGCINEPMLLKSIIDITYNDDQFQSKEALRAAAILGHNDSLLRLLMGLEKDELNATIAFTELSETALKQLVMLSQRNDMSIKTRRQLVRAIRCNGQRAAAQMTAQFLFDNDPKVRHLALGSLMKFAREARMELPTPIIHEAIRLQLDRFAQYVHAKYLPLDPPPTDGFATAPVFNHFFAAEIDFASQQALSELCWLLALIGNAKPIYAAERGLRSSVPAIQRQAVDILQEMLVGNYGKRLFPLLEKYLDPVNGPCHEAITAVCGIDSWLAHCVDGSLDPIMFALYTLRSTSLFAQTDGEHLIPIAEHTELQCVESGTCIMREGEPGNAFFIIQDGACAVIRRNQRVATLDTFGASFGEMALVDNGPRSATVCAIAPLRLLVLPIEVFCKVVADHPSVSIGLIRILARWLREKDTHTGGEMRCIQPQTLAFKT